MVVHPTQNRPILGDEDFRDRSGDLWYVILAVIIPLGNHLMKIVFGMTPRSMYENCFHNTALQSVPERQH